MDKIKSIEVSTTLSYSPHDNITTTLLMKNAIKISNEYVSNDILTESRFQYQNVMPGDGKSDSSNSIRRTLICSVLFVIVLVILTLYFVFRKRKKSRQFK